MNDAHKGTVNERLYESSLMAAFDEAVGQGDEVKLRAILKEIEVDEPSIDRIVTSKLRSDEESFMENELPAKPKL